MPPSPSYAALLQGPGLGFAWGIPFLGLLLTMATVQTVSPPLWARHYGKATLFWILAAAIPLIARFRADGLLALERLMILDYLPFVVSVLALYVIAGGIHVRSRMSGHPIENAILLAFGTLAGGILGTPGATLLFLPVLLKANRWRRYRAHSVIFLIFLVCNIGGGLSPIGPPLLMGYLRGVPFLWTVRAMLAPSGLVAVMLLLLYLALDALVLFPREELQERRRHKQAEDSLRLEGWGNLALIGAAIGVQVVCGTWQTAAVVALGPVALPFPDALRLVGLLLLAALSLIATPQRIRIASRFDWGPVSEVAIVFAGIFVAILPLLAILEAGLDGALAGLIRLVTGKEGQPINWAYFVASGSLSSILDNTPTFLVFFKAAGGDPSVLTGAKAVTLVAISAGAAFWGGLTYVGNAPNFMARAIAERQGVPMPSFAGYMGWAGAVLLPVFTLVALAFFL